MIDLSKSYEFFQPDKLKGKINIVGCGSVGSTVAENLVRCGVTSLVLWDFDTVEPPNVSNQIFRQQDVGKPKVEALVDLLADIDPDVRKKAIVKPNGWNGEMMQGIIVLAADSMQVRRAIVEKHKGSPFVQAVLDVRTRLTDAQHYAADWSSQVQKDNLWNSMDFSDEEAAAETQVSACGVTLGVATTVRLISALCVNNIIRFIKGEPLWRFVQIDGFSGLFNCF
jgi:hypothetical protein